MSALGPVSSVLEEELRVEVHKHGVVFFLDKENAYTGFIDRLAESPDVGFPVCAFRGSFLELLLALEQHGGGVDRSSLVVHLPGFVEDDVKLSPMLELYAAGVRYRKALDTLVTDAAAGRVRPEQIASFRAQDGLTLEGADVWLSTIVDGAAEGLATQLRAMSLEAIVDDLLGHSEQGGFFASRMLTSDDVEAVWAHFARTTGLIEKWRAEYEGRKVPRARDVAFTVASWALVVEYTMDLSRAPADERLATIPGLPRAVVDACRRLCDHLRTRHASFYESTASETETWLPEETAIVRAEDLGRIDTFLFEETAILTAALASLEHGTGDDFVAALAWAEPRAAGKSFWTQHAEKAPLRQNAWQLVLDAARLGHAMTEAGPSLGAATSLDAALEHYVARGAAVDRAHRVLEQRRLAVLYPQVPRFEVLRARLDEMRGRWRTWADGWARDWNTVCREHGFLPSLGAQQRTLFDEVVRPLCVDNEVTAYFVVDALRFEMGEELFDVLGDIPATQKQLKARLAELPTLTEVGMNVLAPVVENGRLRPALGGPVPIDEKSSVKGFDTGEYRVFDPRTRNRAMFDRVGGKGCPWLTLKSVLELDAGKLRKTVEQSRLLVVHSREIDEAGETGVGASVFDKVLQDLRAAWRLLREAGVRRFVITADHGFLLLDDRIGEARQHGSKTTPQRRHVFSSVAGDHAGEVRVALRDLGYDCVEGHVMFPETVAVFDTGARGGNFVHGGNSPQERVIPVLTLVHRSPAGSDTHSYVVKAEAREGIAGMHCLEARVEIVADTLNFGGRKTLELGLRVVDAPEGVVVEVCQARRAQLLGSVIHADVGAPFEVFFRLVGSTDARVLVELAHTGGDATVKAGVVETRFAVMPAVGASVGKTRTASTTSRGWLDDLEPKVRQLFEHLAAHGTVTETEAATMLGGPRELRKFAREFEKHAAKAPFPVRIESVGGVKRYVKDGDG